MRRGKLTTTREYRQARDLADAARLQSVQPRKITMDEVREAIVDWTKQYGELRERLYETEQALAAEKAAREEAENRLREIEEPGRAGARFAALERLAQPVGYSPLTSRPVEDFVRERIGKAETELVEERERLLAVVRNRWLIVDSRNGWEIYKERGRTPIVTDCETLEDAIDSVRGKKGT